jgi:hypothetical protein
MRRRPVAGDVETDRLDSRCQNDRADLSRRSVVPGQALADGIERRDPTAQPELHATLLVVGTRVQRKPLLRGGAGQLVLGPGGLGRHRSQIERRNCTKSWIVLPKPEIEDAVVVNHDIAKCREAPVVIEPALLVRPEPLQGSASFGVIKSGVFRTLKNPLAGLVSHSYAASTCETSESLNSTIGFRVRSHEVPHPGSRAPALPSPYRPFPTDLPQKLL